MKDFNQMEAVEVIHYMKVNYESFHYYVADSVWANHGVYSTNYYTRLIEIFGNPCEPRTPDSKDMIMHILSNKELMDLYLI